MSLDPRTPVVVGVGAVTERPEDPSDGSEALELMAEALERSALDAGRRDLSSLVDTIWTPRGFWSHPNPGGWLAERFDASPVRSVIAEIGILQTSVLARAAEAIAQGHSDVAAIVGGESRDRDSRLARQGIEATSKFSATGEPTELLRPAAEIMSRVEIELGLAAPVVQYALIDNALRAREGRSIDEHRLELGRLWADFNAVAVENPRAWNRIPADADAITTATAGNAMLAFPYTKSLVSQWNVNQAGAVIVCSLERAKRLGLDSTRFVYPLAVVDAEHMVSLTARRALHRSPGFEIATEVALDHVGLGIEEIDSLELYSCFPAAVRVQQREMRVDPDRRVTRTGGMTFAGGPLNNFVIQAWVEMVEGVREKPGSTGLVTAISGLLTKQGVSLFGAEPSRPFLFDQVTERVRPRQATIDVDLEARGRARVAGYTVIPERDGSMRVALVCDLDSKTRALRVLSDPDLAEEGMRTELCDREVELGPGDSVRWL